MRPRRRASAHPQAYMDTRMYMHTCMDMCVSTRTRSTCEELATCVSAGARPRRRSSSYLQNYMHACTHVCMSTGLRAPTARVRGTPHTSARARASQEARERAPADLHAHTHLCVHARMSAYACIYMCIAKLARRSVHSAQLPGEGGRDKSCAALSLRPKSRERAVSHG